MDMQAYLSKLDLLKVNFPTLMSFKNYPIAQEQQGNKFFMIMELI